MTTTQQQQPNNQTNKKDSKKTTSTKNDNIQSTLYLISTPSITGIQQQIKPYCQGQ